MRTVPAVVLLLCSLCLQAGNWPAWRGPDHNGVSAEKNLPTSWSETEHVAWRTPLPGPGPSTPVVWGNRIFLTGADGSGKEANLQLLAIDTSGKRLWTKNIGNGNYNARQGESNGAAPSPTTDGKHVWAFYGSGVIVCYTVDGDEVWRKDLQAATSKFELYFGMSTSPLVHGDHVYLQLLHGGGQDLLALQKTTGKEVWRFTRKTDAKQESLHSYATPIVFGKGNQQQLIVHGADYISGHQLDGGREIWRSGGLQKPEYNPFYRFVTSPIVAGDLLVAPSAKNGPVLGLKPSGAEGNITDNDRFLAWKRADSTPDVPSPVLYDGLLYLNRENGILICMNAETGEEYYMERTHSFRHRSSPVYADGKVYLLAADGTATVVEAGKTFNVLATNRIDEQVAASMAIAGGTIYLRTYDHLYAIRNP